MKILVVGGGGREHAIIKALKEEPGVQRGLRAPPATAASAMTPCA